MTNILFHGTQSDFTEFNDSFQSGINFGKGFYFTEDFNEAKTYVGEQGKVLEVEYQSHNPFLVRNLNHLKILIHHLNHELNEVLKNESYLESDFDKIDQDSIYLKLIAHIFEQNNNLKYYEIKDQIREHLEALGFDGIHDQLRFWWVAFFSSQIKILKTTSFKYKDQASNPFDPNSWEEVKG